MTSDPLLHDKELAEIREQLMALVERLNQLEAKAPPPPVVSEPVETPVSELPVSPQPAPPTVAPRPAAPKPAAPKRSIEQFIGARLFAWIGALIVIVAGAFFAKFAYDEGWITAAPPLVRAIVLGVFGGALILVGDLVRKRFGAAAALGLSIAGVGTLYLDAYAAHRVLELVSAPWAVVFMAIAAFIGIAVTLRSQMISLGIVSLIAGYLAPFLVADGNYTVLLPSFFTLLLVVALILATIRPQEFSKLRIAALCLHPIAAFIWLGSMLTGPPPGVSETLQLQVFPAAWWCLFAVQAVIAVHRGARGRFEIVVLMDAFALFGLAAPVWVRLAIGTSASGYAPLACAAIGTVLALQFGSGARVFSSRARGALDLVTLALWLQTGALLIVGLATVIGGRTAGLAWIALGAVAIELACRTHSRRIFIYAMVAAGLGTVVALSGAFYDIANNALAVVTIGDGNWAFNLHRGDIESSIAALFWLGAAIRLGIPTSNQRDRFSPAVFAAIGSAVVLLVVLMSCANALAPVVLSLIAIGFSQVAPYLKRARLGWLAFFLAVAAIVLWISGAGTRLVTNSVELTGWSFLMNWPMASILVVAAAVIISSRRLAREENESQWLNRIASICLQSLPALLGVLLAGALIAELQHAFRLHPAVVQSMATSGRPSGFVDEWRSFFSTLMVLAGVAGLVSIVARRARLDGSTRAAMVVLLPSAWVWLLVGTIIYRLQYVPPDVPIIWNVQFLAGACLGTSLVVASRMLPQSRFTGVAIVSACACGLWLGTLAIDRAAFDTSSVHAFGITIWWALAAIGMIAGGFGWHSTKLRWLGLGLLSIAACKLLAVDMHQSATIWRVLTGLALGLLMVLVSVVYVRIGGSFTAEASETGEN